jgi:hypothetical protein
MGQPGVQTGQIVAYYLFDVCETFDLHAIPNLIGGQATPARLAPKPATPAYVQYERPPLSFDGDLVGAGELKGFRVRFRVFEYGVVSVALRRLFSGPWSELLALGQTLTENEELESGAEELVRRTTARLRPALMGHRDKYLSEDYLVYAITHLDHEMTADALISAHGDDVAQLLRGEQRPLSAQETATILRHRISYLADDLVVPTWNTALVVDTPEGVQATLEIIEFANSQLLEFRYYDELLDRRLAAIYPQLQKPAWYANWVGRQYSRAARQVHSLFIEVTELTDQAENALKFVGDIYAARLFALVANRLGLEAWKANVQEKLKTIDDISRFTVEQSSVARGNFLELTIVFILVLELILFFMGIMT